MFSDGETWTASDEMNVAEGDNARPERSIYDRRLVVIRREAGREL